MIAAIVLPVALAAVVAFFTAIAPLTSAIGTLDNTVTTVSKLRADIKADVAKHRAAKKKPARKTVAP